MGAYSKNMSLYWDKPAKRDKKILHARGTPKRANRGAFHQKTRKRIIERDNSLCVRCGALYQEIHHVVFRSAGGLGTVDNGVCVCKGCHELAHKFSKVRKWFERYRERLMKNENVYR